MCRRVNSSNFNLLHILDQNSLRVHDTPVTNAKETKIPWNSKYPQIRSIFFLPHSETRYTFGAPQGLENGLVSQGVLATLHDEGEPVVDALMSLLLQVS